MKSGCTWDRHGYAGCLDLHVSNWTSSVFTTRDLSTGTAAAGNLQLGFSDLCRYCGSTCVYMYPQGTQE